MQIRGIAHRGYPVKYPENTLSSFQAAVDLGYTYVELDVQLSKDGVPVVIHDYTVDRMSDHRGNVKDYTLAELKRMKIRDHETIPTLEETMKLLRGKLNVMVELKQAGDLYPGLEQKALDILKQTDTFEQSIIISFDHFCIQRLRALSPDVRLGITTSNSLPYVFPWMKAYRCELLGVPMKMMTEEYAGMIIEHGIEVGPWPVDSLADMEIIAKKYPTTLITTNELERWAQFYRTHPELKRP
ncbi:glycerophosphodiester phosphodiesterase [Paenibacillus mendelii]|uniref:Glycerophosphodiester phosphodiesterase n=1 Tax=Paenibacillus mendelii TaxID=206163 RepID=A0ABV6JJZ9_9BACL|nr:glycerophosphodiester phosphodiesterase family protein [Paenibacillus mendelii]MCQ6559176.1 glycerophosphodiester phosphodiesterase [Paenibacillus mendelii]